MGDLFYVVLYLAGFNMIKHYQLYKDFNKKEVTILNPKEFKVKLTTKDIKRLKSLKLSKDILSFKNTLEENINNDYLNNMYNNFKTIKTKKDLFILLIFSTGGFYSPKKNSITVNEFFKDEVIDHELLHASSAYYDKKEKIAYVGFNQINLKRKKNIGRLLNEGYTCLLVDRYFPNDNPQITKSYKIARLFASQIEKIVGKDIMEEAYFKADLNMLINELEQYDTRENIINVINSLDFILVHLKDQKHLLLNYYTKKYAKDCLIISLEKVQLYLIKWYTKKLQNDLEKNLINEKEFEYELTNFYKRTKKDEMFEIITKKKIKLI